jgi:hypothetical protein
MSVVAVLPGARFSAAKGHEYSHHYCTEHCGLKALGFCASAPHLVPSRCGWPEGTVQFSQGISCSTCLAERRCRWSPRLHAHLVSRQEFPHHRAHAMHDSLCACADRRRARVRAWASRQRPFCKPATSQPPNPERKACAKPKGCDTQ